VTARLGARNRADCHEAQNRLSYFGGACGQIRKLAAAKRLLCAPARQGIAAAAIVGVVGWPLPAAAYRPFDGTDAAVADVGEVEIEFQPIGAIRAGPTNGLSDSIFNYGFADRWELVLQGTAQPLPDTVGPLSVADGAFLKYVVKPGVLQDKSGPSIATEFGPLLPPGRIGRRIWLGRNCVATVGLGNRSPERCVQPNARPARRTLPLTPSSKGRASGRSGRFLKFTRTVSSTRHRHTPPWPGRSGR
jgi:hypothetical protein